MLKYLGYKLIVGLTSTVPRAWQYPIAQRTADLHYLFDVNARRNVLANLRVILGAQAPETIVRYEARWVFRSFGMYMCEFFGHRRFGPQFIDQHVAVQGRENLEAALAKGRGAIVCSAHYSNWELGGTVLARFGYPMVAIALMHPDPQVNALFTRQREQSGVHVVPTEIGARAALRALKEKKLVAVLGDRPTGGPVVPVKLFGRITYLPQGPWRLATASGAPLLPTFIHRRFNRNYTMEIGRPLEAPEHGTREERMAAVAQAWTDCLERRLQADPCQWAVFLNVWDDPHTGALGISDSLAAPNRRPAEAAAPVLQGVERRA